MSEHFNNTIFDYFFNDNEKLCCITNDAGDILKVNKEWENVLNGDDSSIYNNILSVISQYQFKGEWKALVSGKKEIIYSTNQISTFNNKKLTIGWQLIKQDAYVLVSGLIKSISDKESYQKLNVPLYSNSLGVVWINSKGEIKYANNVICESLDYSVEILSQLQIFDIDIHLTEYEFKHEWKKYFTDNISEIDPVKTEFKGNDGVSFVAELSIVSTEDTRDNGLIIIYIKNVTKENEVESYINRLYTALDYVSDAIYWGNMKDLHFQYINKGACDMLGYTREEFKSLTIYDIDIDFVENDPRIDLSIFNSTQENKSFVFEARHRKKNGEIIPVEVNTLYIWVNKEQYVLSFVRDISERKKHELALLKSQKVLRESQRVAKIGNFEMSFKDGSLIWSDEVYSLFGYNKDEITLNFDVLKQIMPHEDYLGVMDALERSVDNNCFYEHEHRGIKKNGELFYVYVSGYLELDHNHEIERVYGVLQDISAQKYQQHQLIQAKEKAEQSDRLKSAFLANVSHEIRTPMNAIIGFSAFLKDEDNTREDIARFADIISNSGEHLLSLINDIIDISKIDTGQVDIVKTQVNIKRLLLEVKDFFSSFLHTNNKKDVELIFEFPVNQLVVFTDEMRLKQILINLISNAVKFTNKGFIKVLCKAKGTYLYFDVIDSGIGISKEKRKIIFERFQQGSATTEKVYGGTGLGLAIAKACVNLLGGEIDVESEEGKGSHFYFTIKV